MIFRILFFCVAGLALLLLWVLLRAAALQSRWEDFWTGKPDGRKD